ncbi:AAA family ATPase [Micromonospora sp. NPDC092111]|uniref:AAA family ATPase n=1 Tax=Micromonospora sp. NPDC092111 TaxID=3364289 RepID=UPI003806E3D4
MNRDQAARYLRRMFGSHTGHVAVAAKRTDQTNLPYRERFEWPGQQDDILDWAEAESAKGHNVFVIPALRDNRGEPKAGAGVNLRWLWAEVDWQMVPESKRAEVEVRIKELATFAVRSGSTHDRRRNVHVYVKLPGVVSLDEHYQLNTGLKEHLYADAKQSDAAYLRLPGTFNHKTSDPVPVVMVRGTGEAVSSDDLERLRTHAVRRSSAPVEWEQVDVSRVPKRWKRLAHTEPGCHPVADRSAALWAIIGDLIKAGLTKDEIHTLMDDAPLSQERNNPERVHQDIEKRWADGEAPSGDEDPAPDDGEAIEELTPDEVKEAEDEEDENLVLQEMRLLRAKDEARRRLAEERMAAEFREPDRDSYGTLADLNKLDLPPDEYLVGPAEGDAKGLLGARHNAVLIAQYKSGKTVLAVDLARCLVDGEPFLGSFPVVRSRVGFWSLEVELHELLRHFIQPVGVKTAGSLAVWDGVGRPVNILSEPGKRWTINWLRQHKVDVWMVDSLAVLAVWAGVDIDKDNGQTRALFAAIDEIKREAAVKVSFVLAHTPRAEMEEGKERARGASAIDEHAGARWIFTVHGSTRFLRINGRGVELKQTSLVWDEETHRSSIGTAGTRDEVVDRDVYYRLAAFAEANPGLSKSRFKAAAKHIFPPGKKSGKAAGDLIDEAIFYDFLHEGQGSQRREKRMKAGPAYRGEVPVKPEGGATSRVIPSAERPGRRSRTTGHR